MKSATLRRNGSHMLTYRVTAHLSAYEVALLLADHMSVTGDFPSVTAAHEEVRRALAQDGQDRIQYLSDVWAYTEDLPGALAHLDDLLRAMGFTPEEADEAVNFTQRA
jgi:hypothetical protein